MVNLQVPAGKHKQGRGGKQGSWKQGGARAPGGSKENVFETLWTRRKFDVLGKKQKGGDAKRVGQARSAALDKVRSVNSEGPRVSTYSPMSKSDGHDL